MKVGQYLALLLLISLGSFASSAAEAQVAQLFIRPGNVGLVTGSSQQFCVFGLDDLGNEVGVPSNKVVWSADPALGTITQSGLFTAGMSRGKSASGVRARLTTGPEAGAVVEVLPLYEQAGYILDRVWKQPLPGVFVQPADIAVGSGSKVYISANGGIQQFSPEGSFLALWEDFGSGKADLDSRLIAIHGGVLYALAGDRIYKADLNGKYIGEIVLPQEHARSGKDFAVDSNGNFYIALGDRITKFSSSGLFLGYWTTLYLAKLRLKPTSRLSSIVALGLNV